MKIMPDNTISYIFTFNSNKEEFILTSSQDVQIINAEHKKFTWLQNVEAGRIIKISAKGKWTSSKDYKNISESILASQKKISKSSAKTKAKKAGNKDKPETSVYCFFQHPQESYFLLRSTAGDAIKIGTEHEKYEWLASQETGRVIKINEKGRWNSSKDYKGLYELIGNVSFDKKKATKKSKKEVKKDAKISQPKGKVAETNDQSEALQKVKKELEVLKKSYAKLLKEKEHFKELWELVEMEMLYAPRDIYMLNGIMAQSDDKHAALKKKAEALGITLYIKENPYRDGKDRLNFWGFKSKVMQLAETTGYANDVGSDIYAKYQLFHITPSYIEGLKSKVRSLNSENAFLKEDLKEARKTVVVKKANKPAKVIVKKQWEAKIVADLTYVSIYSYDKKKTKESITIRIVTKELESKPPQSLFKSFIKLGLQRRTIDNPKSIDYRIYSVSGFPHGLYKNDRKITNILFSFIKEY